MNRNLTDSIIALHAGHIYKRLFRRHPSERQQDHLIIYHRLLRNLTKAGYGTLIEVGPGDRSILAVAVRCLNKKLKYVAIEADISSATNLSLALNSNGHSCKIINSPFLEWLGSKDQTDDNIVLCFDHSLEDMLIRSLGLTIFGIQEWDDIIYGLSSLPAELANNTFIYNHLELIHKSLLDFQAIKRPKSNYLLIHHYISHIYTPKSFLSNLDMVVFNYIKSNLCSHADKYNRIISGKMDEDLFWIGRL